MGMSFKRLHGATADNRTRAMDSHDLEAVTDKPHGLREAFLIDPDGYLWVPDVPLAE